VNICVQIFLPKPNIVNKGVAGRWKGRGGGKSGEEGRRLEVGRWNGEGSIERYS